MAKLLRDGDLLADAEIAEGFLGRLRGLLGRDGLDGVFVLTPASSVHTLGMRFPIDVAWCDADLVVLRTTTLARHRVSRAVRAARTVIEAEAGTFATWNLQVGERLECIR